MNRTLAVLMDPIAAIHPEKDSTLAMLLEAQRRGYELALHATERSRAPRRRALGACWRRSTVRDDEESWFTLGRSALARLASSRRDPGAQGSAVRRPVPLRHDGAGARRDARRAGRQPPAGPARRQREAVFAALFRNACPPTAGRARSPPKSAGSRAEHGEVVLKPLDGMGGASIFRSRAHDPNLNVDPRNADRQRARNFCDGAALHSGDQRRRQAHPDDRRRAGALRARARAARRRFPRQSRRAAARASACR